MKHICLIDISPLFDMDYWIMRYRFLSGVRLSGVRLFLILILRILILIILLEKIYLFNKIYKLLFYRNNGRCQNHTLFLEG